MRSYVSAWWVAFALTCAVELVVAGGLLARAEEARADKARAVFVVLVAQLASHPAVWFIVPELGLGKATTLVSEAWAFGVEALIYAVVLRRRPLEALGVSLLANGLSFGLGLVLQAAHVI